MDSQEAKKEDNAPKEAKDVAPPTKDSKTSSGSSAESVKQPSATMRDYDNIGSQHKPHASVPSFPKAAEDDTKELTDKMDNMSREIEKMQKMAAAEELPLECITKQEPVDYGVLLEQSFLGKMKGLESELEGERSDRIQAQQAVEKLQAANDELGFKVKSLTVENMKSMKQKTFRGLKKMHMQTQTDSAVTEEKPAIPAPIIINPSELKDEIVQDAGSNDEPIIDLIVKFAQEEAAGSASPAQLLAKTVSVMLRKLRLSLQSKDEKTAATVAMTMGRARSQQESTARKLAAKQDEFLGMIEVQEKSVTAMTEKVKDVHDATVRIKSRIGMLLLRHTHEQSVTNSDHSKVVKKLEEDKEKLMERLKDESALVAQLQAQKRELESQLEQQQKANVNVSGSNTAAPERTERLERPDPNFNKTDYGVQSMIKREEVSDEDLHRQSKSQLVNDSLLSQGKGELESLQYYRTIIGQEKQFAETSAAELKRKKGEMVKLMSELQVKNKKGSFFYVMYENSDKFDEIAEKNRLRPINTKEPLRAADYTLTQIPVGSDLQIWAQNVDESNKSLIEIQVKSNSLIVSFDKERKHIIVVGKEDNIETAKILLDVVLSHQVEVLQHYAASRDERAEEMDQAADSVSLDENVMTLLGGIECDYFKQVSARHRIELVLDQESEPVEGRCKLVIIGNNEKTIQAAKKELQLDLTQIWVSTKQIDYLRIKLGKLQQKSRVVSAAESAPTDSGEVVITAAGTEETLKNFRLAVETLLQFDTQFRDLDSSRQKDPSPAAVATKKKSAAPGAPSPPPTLEQIEKNAMGEVGGRHFGRGGRGHRRQNYGPSVRYARKQG